MGATRCMVILKKIVTALATVLLVAGSFLAVGCTSDRPASSTTTTLAGGNLFPVTSGGKWGYINEKGDLVISLQFDGADYFSYGLARVKTASKFGYIDPTGQF